VSAAQLHARFQRLIVQQAVSAEVGKTYLGKVVRPVDFGAFAENRIRGVRDELKEGDQILVTVLALEGNKIKLSRKAVLKVRRQVNMASLLFAQRPLACGQGYARARRPRLPGRGRACPTPTADAQVLMTLCLILAKPANRVCRLFLYT
jgi:hypothetical protein